MTYFLYIVFAILPGIIWLLFYLRKDSHPESHKMVLKVFFYGMLAAFLAIFLELGIFAFFRDLKFPIIIASILNVFIGVALVEEILKYLVVRIKVLNHREFDEPVDAMIYMIIAALGFATLENILIFLQLGPNFLWGNVVGISIFRFWGATFLHTLTSGAIGYFLAMSLYKNRSAPKFVSLGILVGIGLHGLYNFSITNAGLLYLPNKITIGSETGFLLPIIILASLAIFVFTAFRKLKKLKSTCKII